MNTQFYINRAINNGNDKVKNLYKTIAHPITRVEMRLISRLVAINEALEHEEVENLGFGITAKDLRRAYKDVNRLLVRAYKEVERHDKVMKSLDFGQFDRYL